ncbi:MAG: glycosyltransferase [Fibrobacteres bacterium]|jgi:glycosyltransferase involved in cell wall biosynthesis|nr:glycosyltransferase [Fibrobacterota bacterium]
MPRSRIGLVGPDASQPCGIADYVGRLAAVLAAECDLAFVPFRHALASPRLESCQAILVHYERSLVPDPGFLIRLGARFPGRMFVVPHEVYAEDPFAFPYADLRAGFPPLLWLKRAIYRWKHREFARERRLQAAGYAAHRVIPLSGPNAAILGPLAPGKVLEPVPHAFYAPSVASPVVRKEDYFPRRPKSIIGIFGFLNPASDYAQVFDLLATLDPGTALLILGGERSASGMQERLEHEAAARGLSDRVRVTGWLPPERVGSHLSLCDLFVSPMRFKSNSGSLLHLLHLGRPILVPDLPLTRWLQAEGAPVDLYRDGTELRGLALGYLEGKVQPPANRYRWDFPTVARAYLRAMGVG